MILSNWAKTTLEESAYLVRDNCMPVQAKTEKYIGLEHIGQGTLQLCGVGTGKDVSSTKSRFIAGDILFGKLRPYFRKVVMPNFDGICSTDIWVIRAKEDIDQEFLYYVLASYEFVDYVSKGSEGTKMPRAKWDFAEKYEFYKPPFDEQKKVAKILRDLDEKIIVNEKTNKTLEEIAQAIFKHWFVDFEFPDENGQPYKSSGGEMENSELGPIPRGWSIINLEEICAINMGQSPPSSSYNETGYGLPFYQGVRDFGFKYPGVSVYCSEPKKVAEKNDVLLSVRAPVGEINLAVTKCCIGRGVAALCMKEFGNNFLYYTLINNKNRLLSMESGSVFTAINKSNISNFSIIYPGKKQFDTFNSIVGVLDERILINTKESDALTKTRDTLLPKLMSGEIRVPVEEVLEGV